MINDVRSEITDIISDIFDYRGQISQETSRDDIAKWDSLQHVALVSAIEHRFSVSLTMDEMMEIRSVRDIHIVLDRHGA